MSENGEFKIEKEIPAPIFMTSPTSYPFGKMSIGDSFALPALGIKKARSAATQFAKRHNQKFTIRKYGDAFRCWRIQ